MVYFIEKGVGSKQENFASAPEPEVDNFSDSPLYPPSVEVEEHSLEHFGKQTVPLNRYEKLEEDGNSELSCQLLPS